MKTSMASTISAEKDTSIVLWMLLNFPNILVIRLGFFICRSPWHILSASSRRLFKRDTEIMWIAEPDFSAIS